ncbi:radical SAM protein [Clostridia bacterium]|nr:radical SAM protein [Clostridia bacterium]
MTILYYLGNTAYINITNRCSADCEFCLRTEFDSVGTANSLWLEREPTREEILSAISADSPKSIVFCGFGEPFERFDDMLWVIAELKHADPELYVRINTNGHGNLIAGEDITPRLENLVDALSISLNYPNAEAYNEHCRPKFGAVAFDAMLDFTRLSKRYVPSVTLTVVDVLSASHIEECRKIAEGIGVNFRVRAKQ